ncbi:Hypothetical protein Cul210932_0062 [Corynebacterium ulcerans]|nr:Hypothetical protein Cul210932_0062 [Corynebacterium ulcerans]ALD93803.1 Hypothetical protein Cul131001_0063 [Corynebacterium ulcerans]
MDEAALDACGSDEETSGGGVGAVDVSEGGENRRSIHGPPAYAMSCGDVGAFTRV